MDDWDGMAGEERRWTFVIIGVPTPGFLPRSREMNMPQRYFPGVGVSRSCLNLAVTWFLIVMLPCGLDARSWGQEPGTSCPPAGTTGASTWGRANVPDAQEAVLRLSLAIQLANFFSLEKLPQKTDRELDAEIAREKPNTPLPAGR